MTEKLWPGEDSFTEVFDAHQDPNPGENIEDKHGLVSFSTGLMAGTSQFPTLGITGLDLLAVIDPEEYRRVRDAAKQRAALRLRRKKVPSNYPDWLVIDTNHLSQSEEKAALARAGLTIEAAKRSLGPLNPTQPETAAPVRTGGFENPETLAFLANAAQRTQAERGRGPEAMAMPASFRGKFGGVARGRGGAGRVPGANQRADSELL